MCSFKFILNALLSSEGLFSNGLSPNNARDILGIFTTKLERLLFKALKIIAKFEKKLF